MGLQWLCKQRTPLPSSRAQRSRMTAWVGSKKVLGALASRPLAPAPTAMAPTRDELSPRLPRGQLCRRREARRARAPDRAAEGEGDGVSRHRHPRRYRPLRPRRRAGEPDRANGRAASAAFSAQGSLPSLAALLSPYLAAVAAAQALAPSWPGPFAPPLPRLAVDRAPSPAAAGPAHRRRAASGGCRRARRGCSPAIARSR